MVDNNAAVVSNVTCAICVKTYRMFSPSSICSVSPVCKMWRALPCPFPARPAVAIALLPAGGVAALQNNFYVEQELSTSATAAAAARLCDACDDDREAVYSCLQCRQRFCITCRRCHDSISSCRSHTVVPLQPTSTGNLKGNIRGTVGNDEQEEKCLKHKNQPVILHCVACKVSICMQCKLTSHEGHSTEDLADTGNKAKASLQDTLKTLKDHARKLEGVMEAIKQKYLELQVVQEDTEREIRQRTNVLHQWADECRDRTLHTLQSLNEIAITSLTEVSTQVQPKQAALTALSEHITRVLHEHKDTDIVTLNDQLKDSALGVDDVKQLLDDIVSVSKSYQVDHNATAVKIAEFQEYIGSITSCRHPRKHTLNAPFSDSLQSAPKSRAAKCKVARNTQSKHSVHEMFYSTNPESVVESICVTNEKRVWVRFRPNRGSGVRMGLFNQDGLLQNVDDVNENGEQNMITCFDDVTICFTSFEGGSLLKPADCRRNIFKPKRLSYLAALNGVSKCAFGNGFYSACSFDIMYTEVKSTDPLSLKSSEVSSEVRLNRLFDVSCKQEFIAASGTDDLSSLIILAKSREDRSVPYVSSYYQADILGKKQHSNIMDACFFSMDGQEMLLSIFDNDHRIHVVDHTDGCRLVGYLDTNPSVVRNPCRLATDHTRVIWIACKGGTIVMWNVN